MKNKQHTLFSLDLNTRRNNIIRSPKIDGSSYIDSIPYLRELGIEIIDKPQPIQFFPNSVELVHRWATYVQGFSAQFVQTTIDQYRNEYTKPLILDPFAGSGTAVVQSKLNGLETYGIEFNPLLHFVSETKINAWNTKPDKLTRIAHSLPKDRKTEAPRFLKSSKQFKVGVLRNLERLKGGIDRFTPSNDHDNNVKSLLLLAFSAILIDCSNLKRTPCLGYSKKKTVVDNAPFELFEVKISEIANDLKILQTHYKRVIGAAAHVYFDNSIDFKHKKTYDLVITSPPYMNGLDYVMNYKIEMGWLGFAENHKQLKRFKDEMVVCDNVSKGLIKKFEAYDYKYTNDWLEVIKESISDNIERRGNYRRKDMPDIVHKYFDDMYRVIRPVIEATSRGGRIVLVVGDSLIADTYLPTDLILARMGLELGMSLEKIEKARNRRSGQIRSYKLRESIVTLIKN